MAEDVIKEKIISKFNFSAEEAKEYMLGKCAQIKAAREALILTTMEDFREFDADDGWSGANFQWYAFQRMLL